MDTADTESVLTLFWFVDEPACYKNDGAVSNKTGRQAGLLLLMLHRSDMSLSKSVNVFALKIKSIIQFFLIELSWVWL